MFHSNQLDHPPLLLLCVPLLHLLSGRKAHLQVSQFSERYAALLAEKQEQKENKRQSRNCKNPPVPLGLGGFFNVHFAANHPQSTEYVLPDVESGQLYQAPAEQSGPARLAPADNRC